MKHAWIRTVKEHPAPESWERSYALAHFTGEGLQRRAEIAAKVRRCKDGRWFWSAHIDLRRPYHFGDEPTLALAMAAAEAELFKPVRLTFSRK